MNIIELKELLNEKKICIVGAGKLGREDGYLFLKTFLQWEEVYFYDNNLQVGVEVVEGIRTVSFDFLCVNKEEIVCCIVVEKSTIQEELKLQLEKAGIKKIYTLNSKDIFIMCREINKVDSEKVCNYFKCRKYEIQIETTSYCNARCEFCPNYSLKRTKNFMSDEVFSKIIERIKEEKINVSTFILHLNGEPLTDKKIFERIKYIRSEFAEDIKIRFTSNFSLANDQVIKEIFESGLDEITCSLNAINEKDYKDITGLDYKKTIENINKLLDYKKNENRKLDITFSIVKTPNNTREVERFKELYSDKVKVRVMEVGNWVNAEAKRENVKRSRDEICPILYRTINILSNGDYALCCFDAEGIVGGNVMDMSIETAWKMEIFKRIRDRHIRYGKTNPECLECSY